MNIRRRRWVLGLLVAAVAGLGVGVVHRLRPGGPQAHHEQAVYYCPMHPGYTAPRPGDCPICSMKLVKRETGAPTAGKKNILYWTDPMIPGYRSDKPGKSPMGMDLVPVYEGGEISTAGEEAPSGYASVQITPQQQHLIGIKTAPVERRALTKVIRTVGRIAFDPELYQAQEEYLQAARALQEARDQAMPQIVEQAQRVVDAARIRLRLLGVNDAIIEDLQRSGGPDKRLLLNDAPRGVWVYATIYESELPLVRVGQTVTADVPSLAGQTFEGTIQAIDPVLDSMTRSARVRALLGDPEGRLKPQMFVNASLRIGLGEVLAVPEEAIFDTGTRRMVFVGKGEGTFEPREVTVGAKAEGAYEIRSGLSEGESVVVRGNFLLDSESRLKAATGGMMAPPPAVGPSGRRSSNAPPAAGTAGGGVAPSGEQPKPEDGKEHAGHPHGP